jgi:hypothetical protein
MLVATNHGHVQSETIVSAAGNSSSSLGCSQLNGYVVDAFEEYSNRRCSRF